MGAREGVAAAAPRRAHGGGGRGGGIVVSVVNPQPRPVLVYAALCWGGDGEAALTPWDGACAAEEVPRPLRRNEGAVRGANCLQLAAREGTAACEVDEAERAPFGESNTFRYDAASGRPAATALQPDAPPPHTLRLEAAYQTTAGGLTLTGAEDEGDDDLVAEAPFLVTSLPLG